MPKTSCWEKGTIPLPVPNEETGVVWCPVGVEVRQKLGDFIFRYRHFCGQERMDYYTPTNPRTGKQQAWRKIFADGIAAWHALSEEEKDEWRRKAKKKRMVGQHLFQSEWLKAHRLEGQPWQVGASDVGGLDYIIPGNPITVGQFVVGSSAYIAFGVPWTVGKTAIGDTHHSIAFGLPWTVGASNVGGHDYITGG